MQQNIYTEFQTKLDNGLELVVSYLPAEKQMIFRGENINTSKDYELYINDGDLTQKESHLSLNTEEFYNIVVDSLQGIDDKVETLISENGVIIVDMKMPFRSSSLTLHYEFKMKQLEIDINYKVEKLYRKIIKIQKDKDQIQKDYNELKQLHGGVPISTVIPQFNQQQTNAQYYTYPDLFSAIRNTVSDGTTITLYAKEPLKPQGIQVFKLKIVLSGQCPTPYVYVGIAAKKEVSTLVGQGQAYFMYCQNGQVNNQNVAQTYANYPSIIVDDVITITVDMDQGLIRFSIPSPVTNRWVKMTNFDKNTCGFPFVQCTHSTNSVKFVE